MCGLLAVFSQQSVDSDRFQKGLEALNHRGPDGNHHWLSPDKHLALGHTHLLISDPQNGHQPLLSADGQMVLIANGEFYDTSKLRQRLQSQGYIFHSQSDSEVALYLYQAYGLDFLPYLRGEFALVIWDQQKRQLLAIRDRFGIKPLVYHNDGQTLTIASEAKAILATGVPAIWDQEAFFHTTQLQYLPPDRTLFRGIHQIPPGHFLQVKNEQLTVHRYWDLDYPLIEDCAFSERECLERLQPLLQKAIDLRLETSASTCFYLSGGLDSSTVVGMGYQPSAHCFSASFQNSPYDELSIATETAAYHHAVLHPIVMTQQRLVDEFSDSIFYTEGLAINGHVAAKRILCQAMKQAGFKVALTGEGADELFAGYAHFHPSYSHIKNRVAGIHLPTGEGLNLNIIHDTLDFIPTFLVAKATLGYRIQQLLKPEFIWKQERPVGEWLMQTLDINGQLKNRHPFHQSAYLWIKLALANYILRTVGDGAEMSYGLEGRVPFLDHHLFECVRHIPISLLLHPPKEKHLLRQLAQPYLTETVYQRPKQPFMSPPLSPHFPWVKWLEIESPFFNQKAIQTILSHWPSLSTSEQTAWDAALTMVASTLQFQTRFSPKYQ